MLSCDDVIFSGWSDIGYNFLVGNDGNVYEGRGWNRVGAQTYNYNSVSIGIAFIGNFNSHLPNGRALNAAKQLIACGVSQVFEFADANFVT
jgi:N-acetylmuramoyl-L-alanine amidase